MQYVQLAEAIPNENRSKNPSQKMKVLVNDVDNLLTNQPYLSQALEETLHFLYWDISEGDLGKLFKRRLKGTHQGPEYIPQINTSQVANIN